MGSALQRLEILLIGLVLVIAGAIIAILMIIRPAMPAASVAASPPSVATLELGMPTSITSIMPTSVPAPRPTLIATEAPMSALAPTSVPLSNLTSGMLGYLLAVGRWPLLILTVGLIGLQLALRRFRRRRMSYTNQNVSQLLAAADAETRATNLRVMRSLAQQGVLPAELAVAAGIDLSTAAKQPHVRRVHRAFSRIVIPRVAFPTLAFPTLRRPTWLRRRGQRPITINGPSPAASAMSHPEDRNRHNGERSVVDGAETLIEAACVYSSRYSAAAADDQSSAHASTPVPAAGLSKAETRTIESRKLPKTEILEASDSGDSTTAWTAEDRVLAAAAALVPLWVEQTIKSTILAIDTHIGAGDAPVLITLDGHPGEEQLINELPDLIVARHPGWHATWRRDHLEVLVERTSTPVTSGTPLIVPVLTHGRGGTTMRFFPLGSWRHLGIYGGEALAALHAILGSLLYTQSPADLALAILDHGEITPLYRDVTHLVALPDTPHGTIEILAQTIKRGTPRVARPLLLVVVEPDDNELSRLIGLAAWLQARPATPLHLLIVQTRPRIAGRELYAQLPALLVSGGAESTTLLPGQGTWPKRGAARLVAHGMRIEGRAITLDEMAIVQMLAPLRQQRTNLSPVLWDVPEPSMAAHVPAQVLNDSEVIQPEHDVAEHRRRIADTMTRRRQALMDAERADVPIATHDATRVEPLVPILADEPAPVRAGIAASMMADRSRPMLVPTMPSVTDDHVPVPTNALAPNVSHDASAPNVLDDRTPLTEVAPVSPRAELFRSTRATGDASAPPIPTFVPRSSPATLASSDAVPDRPSDPPPMHESENGWPIGPAPLGRVAMADLMSRVVAAPAIVAGLPSEQGMTKNRMVEVFVGIPRAQAKELAEILLAWFDQAGLLVEPTKPGRLRHPRALVTTNLAAIAARLNATPCPDKGTVVAMWAESNEGRN